MDDVKWTCMLCGETKENKTQMTSHLRYVHEIKHLRKNKKEEIVHRGKLLATPRDQLEMTL